MKHHMNQPPNPVLRALVSRHFPAKLGDCLDLHPSPQGPSNYPPGNVLKTITAGQACGGQL
eukprot:1161986-Pelagomonas_calceolata.AAC.13